jgi:hypothetical protein
MSRRTKVNVPQTPIIARFFSTQAAGVSFASQLSRCLVAAVSCGVVGGCVVTSAEEFPEQTNVPPVVVDTPDLATGDILTFDPKNENELRLPITVRDDNLDDDVFIQARLTVLGQPMADFVCVEQPITPSGLPERAQFSLVVDRSMIRAGACTKVELAVSSKFFRGCRDPIFFGQPQLENDVGHAKYWIWELSGNPAVNATAAQAIYTSCDTVTQRAPMTAMPTGQ